MPTIIDLLGNASSKIWEAAAWLLNQIAIFAPDLLYHSGTFESILGYATHLWKSDWAAGGFLCGLVGRVAEVHKC